MFQPIHGNMFKISLTEYLPKRKSCIYLIQQHRNNANLELLFLNTTICTSQIAMLLFNWVQHNIRFAHNKQRTMQTHAVYQHLCVRTFESIGTTPAAAVVAKVSISVRMTPRRKETYTLCLRKSTNTDICFLMTGTSR